MDEDVIKSVSLVAESIIQGFSRFCALRCHEVIRIIAPALELFGEVKIYDGVVFYDGKTLLEKNHIILDDEEPDDFFDFSDLFSDLRDILSKEKSISFFHSWCEITTSTGEIIVVDYHPLLQVNDNFGATCKIIDYKFNLSYQYYPVAHKIGKYLIWLDRFPPYVVKLRI
ncbi:MAG: hypothetical protein PHR47_00730 [Candidatus Pacebacteria bacterium]|nr:hypothetical protein [Candidatus Paceibacterota bacterium]